MRVETLLGKRKYYCSYPECKVTVLEIKLIDEYGKDNVISLDNQGVMLCQYHSNNIIDNALNDLSRKLFEYKGVLGIKNE